MSHIGEKSFWDTIAITKKPIIASHSSVYNLCPHFRNLKDDQIVAIKNTNGFIGLNPYPFFIDFRCFLMYFWATGPKYFLTNIFLNLG